MGYTHYWEFKRPKGMKAKELEKLYQKAIEECQFVVRKYYKEFGGLSGYTAHTKKGTYGGLLVNGKGSDAHENFVLREHFKQNFEASSRYKYQHCSQLSTGSWGFCKTDRKPYDNVVVACLCILKYRLKDAFSFSSDGFQDELEYGRNLARRYLNRPGINIPDTVYKREIEQKLYIVKGGKQ